MSEREHEDESEVCAKCGQEVDGDWEDSFPEPLCYGCSHAQNGIDGGPP